MCFAAIAKLDGQPLPRAARTAATDGPGRRRGGCRPSKIRFQKKGPVGFRPLVSGPSSNVLNRSCRALPGGEVKQRMDQSLVEQIICLSREHAIALELNFEPEQWLQEWAESLSALRHVKVWLEEQGQLVPSVVTHILERVRVECGQM